MTSSQQLFRPQSKPSLNLEDPSLKNIFFYTGGSCILLVLIFVIVLPTPLANYYRRIKFIRSIPAIEDTDDLGGVNRKPAILCHLNLSSFTRSEPMTYSVFDVPTNYCSHIVFPIKGLDDWFDDMLNYDAYQSAIHPNLFNDMDYLKHHSNIKILVSVGLTEDASDRFVSVARSHYNTIMFARNLFKWLLGNKIDGVVLNGLFFADPEGANESILLLERINTLFRPKHLILTAVFPFNAYILTRSYEGDKVYDFIDYAVVQTHGFIDSYSPYTDVHSAIRPRVNDHAKNFKDVIRTVLTSGMPSWKVLASIALDGVTFRLNDSKRNGLRSPTRSASGLDVGRYTTQYGILAYFEICDLVMRYGWHQAFDEASGCPYAFKEDRWIGYEDKDSIELKMELVKKNVLGGVMVWDVTSDDYRGICGEPNQLMRTIKEETEDDAYQNDAYLKFG